MDCGPTCLRMVAKYHKRSIGMQSLRESMQIGKDGVSMLGISDAAERLGFRTRAVKIPFSFLIEKAYLPCILFWDQAHFVVLPPLRQGKPLAVVDRLVAVLVGFMIQVEGKAELVRFKKAADS